MTYWRKGDTFVCHSPDRLARNAGDLLHIVRELTAKSVTVEFASNPELTFRPQKTTPTAHLMLAMLAGFAQFERGMIRERQAEGIAIAKAKGVYKGRAKRLTPAQAKELRRRTTMATAKVEPARYYGISRQAVYDYLRA